MDNSNYYAHYGIGKKVGHYNDLWKDYTIDPSVLISIYKVLQDGCMPQSFIDIGCADGRFSRAIENLGVKEVRGIDIDPDFCKNDKVDIEICSILDYTKPLDYDLVYVNNVWTYFSEQELDSILPKFKPAKVTVVFQANFEKGFGQDGDPFPVHKLVRPVLWWCDKFARHGLKAGFSKALPAYALIPADDPPTSRIDWTEFKFADREIRHRKSRIFFDEKNNMVFEGAPRRAMRTLLQSITSCGYSVKAR